MELLAAQQMDGHVILTITDNHWMFIFTSTGLQAAELGAVQLQQTFKESLLLAQNAAAIKIMDFFMQCLHNLEMQIRIQSMLTP